ncbi:MAG: hypothetical protein K8F62_20120 [Pseudorhodoplanes sp.]|nr:hypothetical protein [Pseudorhodoplanes sp.]
MTFGKRHRNSGLPELRTGKGNSGLPELRKRKRRSMMLCIPLLGCLNGDFGRVRQSLIIDDIHAWVGREAALEQGIPPSEFRLTDEERLLRDLAFPLIEAPYGRQRWFAVLSEYGISRVFLDEWWTFDPAVYAEWLLTRDTRSTSSLYARLIDDIRNDILRIGPFLEIARKVVDLDSKRDKSLAYVSVLSPEELADAKSRMAENRLVIGWVHRALNDRAASYRFAMERLVIHVPSYQAVDVERQWTLLRTRIGQARIVPPAPIAAVVTK